MAEVTQITTLDNGPFIVKGAVEVLDAQGNLFPSEREVIALCRCGGSTTKPFCDGAHAKLGFQSAERALGQASVEG